LKQLMDVIHYATDAGDHVVGNARLSWYAMIPNSEILLRNDELPPTNRFKLVIPDKFFRFSTLYNFDAHRNMLTIADDGVTTSIHCETISVYNLPHSSES
jgi:hypothetical protein